MKMTDTIGTYPFPELGSCKKLISKRGVLFSESVMFQLHWRKYSCNIKAKTFLGQIFFFSN